MSIALIGGFVSPAHAGIDQMEYIAIIAIVGFPRPRGDRPSPYEEVVVFDEFPPPTRG